MDRRHYIFLAVIVTLCLVLGLLEWAYYHHHFQQPAHLR
jgi:hypothetical protein